MADSRLNSLPSEVKLIIFSKLPAELVLDCKRVCKDWRNLIHHHADSGYFANLHLRCQYGHGLVHGEEPHQPSFDSSKMSFVTCYGKRDLYYVEYYDDNKMNLGTKRISLKFLAGDIGLVGSCNGLICLSAKRSYNRPDSYTYHDCYDESIYICNLIIGEVVNLPGTCINRKNETLHGFGYHPLTNEYKVLRISYQEYGSKGLVEVYTLGSESGWRSKGDINYRLLPNREAGSVCANGALHWLQEGSEDILDFDLADEEFHLLKSPPNQGQGPFDVRALAIFGGCLVLVNNFNLTNRHRWDLWFLEEDKEANYTTKESCTIDPCWSKKYTMFLEWKHLKFPRLFALSGGGQLLIMSLFGFVFRYNLLESQVSDDIWEFAEQEESWAVPIQHQNTFVSLKAIGEENVGTFTADGELKFPSSRKKKSGVIKITAS